ncbi:hypothetical protein [Marinobacter salarius]|uniref:Uncharacterized protein n=1 Tax=Marinobacter salarius TaxID=1420917 RepID=A0A1W6KFK5_9GAMM|nr:hypothetical protein [Marinobacter salarius]ARM86225.1 hypothetical protein MARSALSMR5_04205 [Marinobacter salarius]
MADFDIFESAKKEAEKNQHDATRAAAAKTAALASLSVIRTISKVLAASMDGETIRDPKGTEQRASALIDAIGEQSLSLHEKLGSVSDNRILPSLTGSVTTVLQSLYRTNGETALDIDVASLLAETAQAPGIWKEDRPTTEHGSLEYRRTISMMQAMSPVLAAWERFDFHQRGNRQQATTDLHNALWETVDKTMRNHPVINEMDEPEQEALRRNLLVRSGEMMASAWDNQIPIAKAHMAECTTEERRAYKTEGYPIEPVIEQFRTAYTMLEQTLDTTLNSQFTSESEDQAPGPR